MIRLPVNCYVSDDEILAECIYSKNVMLQIHGKSPYQAVIGRTPPALQEVEKQSLSAVADASGGKASLHATRVRELALQAIVEGTAQDRIQRAASTQTRAAAETMKLEVGQFLDIYRVPSSKENSGWRGPCQICSVANLHEGYVEVKWAGRAVSARLADVRHSLVYVTLLDTEFPQLSCIQNCIAEMKAGSMTLAMVFAPHGWELTKAAKEKPRVFQAGLFIGFNVFHLRCCGVRLGQGISYATGMASLSDTVLMWWPKSERSAYKTMVINGKLPLQLKATFGDEWNDIHWAQFLGTSSQDAKALKKVRPDEPMLGDDPDQGPQAPPGSRIPVDDQSMPHGGDSDEEMGDEPGELPPPPPPPQQPRPGVQRYPIHSGNSSRSRTSLASTVPRSMASTKPHAMSTENTIKSIHTDTTQNTLPKGWTREHRQQGLEPKRLPGPSRGTGQPASSSWEVPTRRDEPQPVTGIELPIHDTDDDAELEEDVDDVETIVGDNEYDFYAIPTKHPQVHINETYQTTDEVIDEQFVYATTGIETTTQLLDDDDDIEVEFPCYLARLCEGYESIKDDEILVFAVSKKSGKTKKMIQKDLDVLTAQDIKTHWEAVQEACRSEIQSFKDHGTYEVKRATDCPNTCSSKWVFRFKEINGKKAVKARLTVRGFEDLARDMQCFSATASRWTQKVILSVAVQRGWELMMADVATAFLQGMTFQELSALQGTPVRQVAFRPPKGSEHWFQKLEGTAYQPGRDVLSMLKPVYGLKDAPAAWRAKLSLVLKSLGGRPCHMDSCLWLWHQDGLLTAIISTHVDDLKGAGIKAVIQKILAALEKAFGRCKTAFKNFLHCGILHEQSEDLCTIRIHQNQYVQQLQALDMSGIQDAQPLNSVQHADYLSLLGGLSWTVQTRQDIAVFICALQRAAKSPLGEHSARCNKVLKWARKHPYYLTYKRMIGEIITLTISDSAFRKEDARGLAMRGSITGLSPFQEETPGNILHVIMFWASKQRRVTRSTFSSELNSLVDSIDFAKQLAMLMAEIVLPETTARGIVQLEENGQLPLSIVAVIDAQSVFDALRVSELRTPSEGSLMLMMCGIKEMLRSGSLRRLFWVDTTDMVADGLGKGTVSRQALMQLGETGEWWLQYAAKGHTEQKFTPISEQ